MNEHDNLKVFDVIIPNIKCGYLTIEQGSTERKLCRIMKQDCSRDICPKPKPDTRPAEEVVDELIDPYRAVIDEEACPHCDKGETWTVKCPDGTYLGETWGDSDGQANAEEMAEALNCAYKQGYAAARARLVGDKE